MTTVPIRAGVLFGGESRRMGAPKHLERIGERTLIELACAPFVEAGFEVTLLGAGSVPPALASLAALADDPTVAAPRSGPLAGMLTAMTSAPDAAWIFVACDMPRVTPEAIAWLVSERDAASIAVLPRVGDEVQTMLALYEPAALGALADLGRAGKGPRDLAERGDVRTPGVPPHVATAWVNVNTRDELSVQARR
ncbi:molybdenum cofactor guanylyltransferase [bacterium]|nr:molybdenum cofactor guanylyltransferase [bacterium]